MQAMRMVPALTMVLLCAGQVSAQAPAYPARPVHIVVGFPPGGGADVVARSVAARMGEFVGQPVLVENRAGASGNIAAAAVAKSAPDGYLVYLATASNAITAGAALNGGLKLDYDVQKDLRPVVLLVRNQNVLVANPALPAANLRELISLARNQPGKLNFGVMAPSSQLAGELLRQMAGISIVDILYKGAAPVVTDLVGGQVELAILDVVAALPHIRSGKLRALAVTSGRRFEGLPDVPTMAEAGVPGYEAIGWLGLMVPAATPNDVVARLRDAATRALAGGEIRERLAGLAVTPAAGGSDEFGAFLRSEIEKWARVLRTGGIVLGS